MLIWFLDMGCEDTTYSGGAGESVDTSGLSEVTSCFKPKDDEAINRAKKLKALLESAGINKYGALGLAAVCIDESAIIADSGKNGGAQGIFQMIGQTRKQILCMAGKDPNAKVHEMTMEQQVELIKAAVFYKGGVGACGGFNDSHFSYFNRVFKTLNLCNTAEEGLYTAYCMVKNSGPANDAWSKRPVTREEYLKCFAVYNKSQTAANKTENGRKKLAAAMACAKEYAKKIMA